MFAVFDTLLLRACDVWAIISWHVLVVLNRGWLAVVVFFFIFRARYLPTVYPIVSKRKYCDFGSYVTVAGKQCVCLQASNNRCSFRGLNEQYLVATVVLSTHGKRL